MLTTQAGATGQWFTGSDGRNWWFDSGALSLDFAYTGAFAQVEAFGDHPEWESVRSEADLAGWLRGRFAEFEASVTDRELTDALALRAAIGRAFLARSHDRNPDAEDIDVINLFAATPNIPPVLAGGTRQAGRATARAGQALSELAREAVKLLSPSRSERIRECSATDCALAFYDESRSNNRRWCSMQRCGNRSKVRAHRANQKLNR